MRDNDTPARADSGLSTDDIAGTPQGTGTTGTDPREERGRSSDQPPVYPGESTPTGTDADVTDRDAALGDERDGGGEAGGRSAETRTSETPENGGAQESGGAPESGGRDEPTSDAPHPPPHLLDPGDEDGFRARWHDIQSQFVDDPREAVHAADALVAEVMQRLAATFADHRKTLEGQWNRGEDVDTESLRTALRQYRSFFHRLLSTGGDGGGEAAASDRRPTAPPR
ncbi:MULTISPECIES: hypothetical protein [Streptomyces]|uniref:Uncharacterized protein n=1 Tax=Streptomyces venezuelae (strain ATCC 10712 / CBS 650.69 / DSM 40230 / JCM 4526 / NBRC 13096 / PD 04745) TaxID=953739 RepID=F2RHN6_STRVP|nr:hypothetical protein [Streptomyces venezuelae]CCA59980.1 hypothetical protein SVEN_6694 [Streptomyces venezuelae ATCC 10712]